MGTAQKSSPYKNANKQQTNKQRLKMEIIYSLTQGRPERAMTSIAQGGALGIKDIANQRPERATVTTNV